MGYIGGLSAGGFRESGSSGPSMDHALRTEVKELERRMNRLELANRAMWEMIRDATKLTEADLEKRMKEIDLRDGVADDQISTVPLRCPSCKRVASSKHWRCLYCGQEFQKYAY